MEIENVVTFVVAFTLINPSGTKLDHAPHFEQIKKAGYKVIDYKMTFLGEDTVGRYAAVSYSVQAV